MIENHAIDNEMEETDRLTVSVVDILMLKRAFHTTASIIAFNGNARTITERVKALLAE